MKVYQKELSRVVVNFMDGTSETFENIWYAKPKIFGVGAIKLVDVEQNTYCLRLDTIKNTRWLKYPADDNRVYKI